MEPVIISNAEIFCLLNIGSRIAVNNVSEERQTRVTETVEDFIDWKNRIQCRPTIAPVKNNFRNTIPETFNGILAILKYAKSVINAMKTRYHTSCVAGMEINAPNMPVKPQTKTVRCSIIRFLFTSVVFVCILK